MHTYVSAGQIKRVGLGQLKLPARGLLSLRYKAARRHEKECVDVRAGEE